LLAGSDRERVRGIRALLRQDGHRVAWLRSIERWRDREAELEPELIVAAVGSTAELTDADAGPPAGGFPAPLLFVQHDANLFRDAHLDERLVDRIESPFMAEDLLGRVDALVRARRVIQGSPRPDPPTGLVRRSCARLATLLQTRVPRFDRPLAPYLEVAARIADWTDRRDTFEPGHAERVTSFAALIAEALALPEDEAPALLRAAMLHDIGKVGLPVEVLRQAAPLEEGQRRLIRTHPERGARLLRALDGDERVARAVLYHHEQPDGAGYYGKARDAIPRWAAILAVAEAYDAMTSTQLTRPLSSDAALGLLRQCRGEKFDSDAVDALVNTLRPRSSAISLGLPMA
jgi:putative nucleotidyltransferase with HDIG domain